MISESRSLFIIGKCWCWILSKTHEKGKIISDCIKGGPYRGCVGTMETESGKLHSVLKFDRILIVISLDEGRDYLLIFLWNCWSDLGKTSALIQYAQKISYFCFLSILCLSLRPYCCLILIGNCFMSKNVIVSSHCLRIYI